MIFIAIKLQPEFTQDISYFLITAQLISHFQYTGENWQYQTYHHHFKMPPSL